MAQFDSQSLQVVAASPRSLRGRKGGGSGVAQFPSAPTRVYVLRFDPLRATGLQAIFQEHAGIDIVVETSPDEAGSGWLDPAIDIVVVGAQLGGGTLKLISSIRLARPKLPVLLMSPAAGDEAILSLLSLGAKGFLHEASTAADFEEAIHTVRTGSLWAPRRLQAELIERLLALRDAQTSSTAATFTMREQQVLELLLDGQSNREIARTLKIEERTVKSYVARLMGKMGVRNRTALSMQVLSTKDR